MKNDKPFSFRERLQSFPHAFRGLATFFKIEHNARIHLGMGILAILISFWLKISGNQFCIVVLTIAMVWAAEALNTVLEILVNMVSPNYSDAAKLAKDVGAAAVLIASMAAVVVGAIILLPLFIERVSSLFASSGFVR